MQESKITFTNVYTPTFSKLHTQESADRIVNLIEEFTNFNLINFGTEPSESIEDEEYYTIIQELDPPKDYNQEQEISFLSSLRFEWDKRDLFNISIWAEYSTLEGEEIQHQDSLGLNIYHNGYGIKGVSNIIKFFIKGNY